MRHVSELGSPSSGRLQKLPTTVSSPSNQTSGHSVSCLQNLSRTVEYLIQVSVMSITCTVKVAVIQRVHQVPLGFPVNAVLKQIPPTYGTTVGFLHVKSTVFLSPVARIDDMNKRITFFYNKTN